MERLRRRVESIERQLGGGGWRPVEPSLDPPWRLLSERFGISLTPEEAWAKGYGSLAEEAAATFGITCQRLKQILVEMNEERQAQYEFRTIGGREYARERQRHGISQSKSSRASTDADRTQP